jgi:replicative DNA helicase
MIKKLPQAIEAETGVVGSCLLDSPRAPRLCLEMGVYPEKISDPSLRLVYQTIINIYKSGEYIDILTVSSEMERGGLLDVIGGTKFIDNCVDKTPTAAHVEAYAKEVNDTYKNREIIKLSHDISHWIENNERSSNDVLSDVIKISGDLLHFSDKPKVDFHSLHKSKRELSRQGRQFGFESNWEDLNYLLNGYSPPSNIIIAAKSSIGKTIFVCNELVHIAKSGVPVGLFTTDMTEEAIRERMAAEIGDVNFFKFGKPSWTDEEANRIDFGYETLKNLPIYICDDAGANINDFIAWTASMVARHKVKIVALDFLQQLNRTRDELHQDIRISVGDWSKSIKSLGKKHDIVTFVVSQLARYGKEFRDTTPPRPSKEDLKESGELENNADIIILLCHEPNQPKELFTYKHKLWNLDLIVDKHRNGPCGVLPMALYTTRSRIITRSNADLIRMNDQESKYDARH